MAKLSEQRDHLEWWVIGIEGRLIGGFLEKSVAVAILNTQGGGKKYWLKWAAGWA